MDDFQPVGRQVENLYRKHLLSLSTNDTKESAENEQRLRSKVRSLLLVLPTTMRHSQVALDIIQSSIDTMDNFDGKKAAAAFLLLEKFAKNLIYFPWKSGYRRIKIYSGLVRLKIDNCLKGTRLVFEALGYRKHKDEFILEKTISREERELIALDCYVAAVEMQIYREIYERVVGQGYSYRDVHRARLNCNQDVYGCEIWINKHCTAARVGEVPTRTVTIPQPLTQDDLAVDCELEARQFPPPPSQLHFDVHHQNYDIREHTDMHMQFGLGDEFNIMGSYTTLPKHEMSARNFSGPRAHDRQAVGRDRPMDVDPYSPRVKTVAMEDRVAGMVSPKGGIAFFQPDPPASESSYVPGTIDDHVKESMKLLEEEASKPAPTAPPPSYQSVYPDSRGQRYDEEWGHVRSKIQDMGSRFADPGGRGDILRGDNMVPIEGSVPAINAQLQQSQLYKQQQAENEMPPPPPPQQTGPEDDDEFPPPPPPEYTALMVKHAEVEAKLSKPSPSKPQVTPVSCTVQSQPKTGSFLNIVKDTRRLAVVADGPESPGSDDEISRIKARNTAPTSPITYQPTSSSNAARQGLMSKISQSEGAAYGGSISVGGGVSKSNSRDNMGGKSYRSREDLLAQSPSSNTPQPFSTFKGSGGTSPGVRSPDSGAGRLDIGGGRSPILNRPMHENRLLTEQADDIDNDPGANDVYVSLRENSTGSTLVTGPSSTIHHGGKPNYQDNFQKTTQRFYSAGETQFQSLPPVSKRTTIASTRGILQSTPVSDKDKKNLLIKRSASVSEEAWQCRKCTFANHGDIAVCEMCGGSRELGTDQKLSIGGNQCKHCTLVNDPGSADCKACKKSLKGAPTYI